MNSAVQKHYERILLVHNEYVLKHRNLPLNFNLELIVKYVPEIPHQSNGCGVFLLEFMKYTTMNKPFNFSCSDMIDFRQQLKHEFESKIIESLILQARIQSLPHSNTTKLKSLHKEQLSYSNIRKEVKTIPDISRADHHEDNKVTQKILRFIKTPRKNQDRSC